MGVAAYNRASSVIRQRVAESARPLEFEFMDDLNSMPKFKDAGTPFGEIHFIASHGGCFAECPTTGYGYWYRTLREAVRRWRVEVYAHSHGTWVARPMPGDHVSVNDCWGRK